MSTLGRSMTRSHPHCRGRGLLLREDEMDRHIRQYHGRRVENNRIKSLVSNSHTLKYRRDPPDESQDDRDDRTSRSGTPSCPSMTHCSSTSAASSIIACEHGLDGGQCQACLNLPENYTYQNSDGEYVL
jgi:hypothetical protein